MIVLFGGEKGGVGKSTLLSNLAVLRALSGRDILLLDTDPQGSLAGWNAIRNENELEPSITCVQRSVKKDSIKAFIREVRKLEEKYDDIFIDAGGRDSVELRSAMVVADIMLSPIQASQYDLWSLERLDELVQEASPSNLELKAYTVINRVSTNPSVKEAEEAMELLTEFPNLCTLNTTLKDRISFRKSVREGKSVLEFLPKDKKAITEIKALYKELFDGQ